jgi:hypothetical protein
MEPPAFYRDKARQITESRDRLERSDQVRFARDLIRERGGAFGHGFLHAERVAVEAGAIVYSELGFGVESDRLAGVVLVAGYLHDLRRDEKDHPEKAAGEVREIFRDRIDERLLDMVVFAIRGHEAFKERLLVDDAEFMLCADALYDADKFRWGPDNFTETLWNMAESMKIGISAVMGHYEKGIKGIIRIKDTFRTETGRKYGPGFIDAGLKIGEELYGLYRKNQL